MTPSAGIEPGPHWWETSALTTAPSLLPRVLVQLNLVCHRVKGFRVPAAHPHPKLSRAQFHVLRALMTNWSNVVKNPAQEYVMIEIKETEG